MTYSEHRSGFFADTTLEYGSGTPAVLRDSDGEVVRVRLPDHFIANLDFGVDLFRREQHSIGLQVNIENAANRIYRIAKESEFTPVQFSPPRFISGSMRFRF